MSVNAQRSQGSGLLAAIYFGETGQVYTRVDKREEENAKLNSESIKIKFWHILAGKMLHVTCHISLLFLKSVKAQLSMRPTPSIFYSFKICYILCIL